MESPYRLQYNDHSRRWRIVIGSGDHMQVVKNFRTESVARGELKDLVEEWEDHQKEKNSWRNVK